MHNEKIKVSKVKNKMISESVFSKITISGNFATAQTSHLNNIPASSYWRGVKNAGIDIQKKFFEKYKHKNFKDFYYRFDKNNFLEFKKIVRNKTKTKAENVKKLKKQMIKHQQIINCNFNDFTKMLTLTYEKQTKDFKQIYKDFSLFIKRLKNYLSKQKIKFEYTRGIEPHETGFFHIHCYLYLNKNKYLDNYIIERLWGLGFTSVIKAKIENGGAYLTSYLTDLPTESHTRLETAKEKKKRKGARLHLYPNNLKMLTHSRGVKKPIVFTDYHILNKKELKHLGFNFSKKQNKYGYIIRSAENDKKIKSIYYENYYIKNKIPQKKLLKLLEKEQKTNIVNKIFKEKKQQKFEQLKVN